MSASLIDLGRVVFSSGTLSHFSRPTHIEFKNPISFVYTISFIPASNRKRKPNERTNKERLQKRMKSTDKGIDEPFTGSFLG